MIDEETYYFGVILIIQKKYIVGIINASRPYDVTYESVMLPKPCRINGTFLYSYSSNLTFKFDSWQFLTYLFSPIVYCGDRDSSITITGKVW